MITFTPINKLHYNDLFQIEQREYPIEFRSTGYEAFCAMLDKMIGITLYDGQNIIGAVYFNTAGNDIELLVHGFVDQKYHGRCLTRPVLRSLHQLAFNILGRQRVGIPLVKGSLPRLEKALVKIGFKHEGYFRRAIMLDGKPQDILYYGLIESDFKI